MSSMPAQEPEEKLYYLDLYYPHPPGWSPERVRRLHQMEHALVQKPEFRHLSLLETPTLVRQEVPAELAVQIRAQMAQQAAPVAAAQAAPVEELGPAARKRARRAAAARHNEQAQLARQPAANDD